MSSMRRITRNFSDSRLHGSAPEKISDAVEDFVEKVLAALVDDGVDGIGLEERIETFAEHVQWVATGFNNGIVGDFEQRLVDQDAMADLFKRGNLRGGGVL